MFTHKRVIIIRIICLSQLYYFVWTPIIWTKISTATMKIHVTNLTGQFIVIIHSYALRVLRQCTQGREQSGWQRGKCQITQVLERISGEKWEWCETRKILIRRKFCVLSHCTSETSNPAGYNEESRCATLYDRNATIVNYKWNATYRR